MCTDHWSEMPTAGHICSKAVYLIYFPYYKPCVPVCRFMYSKLCASKINPEQKRANKQTDRQAGMSMLLYVYIASLSTHVRNYVKDSHAAVILNPLQTISRD